MNRDSEYLTDQHGEFRDITPNPRILRTLGEIPFEPWQCIAELVDNSLDAFREDGKKDTLPNELKRVVVSWSSDNVAAKDRILEVLDTGPGMTLEEIQESVRAGYTSNNPISNLGLFGMGFNIATARLGEKTTFLSATPNSQEWVGIEIDFDILTKSGKFKAPVVRLPKHSSRGSGTKVIISRLKPGIYDRLKGSSSEIRKILADIYSPILQDGDVEIMVQGKVVTPFWHCVWESHRHVPLGRGGDSVPAVTHINEPVGEKLFYIDKNRYLTPDEEDEAQRHFVEKGEFPDGIVKRAKLIRGWLGIQRYGDPNDYGIDFIRNGRKILRRDKSLFFFENLYTGTKNLEYPLELGTTFGGRIVGEIHIDHVPPTYQKNDFDRSDPSWYEVIELLRGSGPIRSKSRTQLGLEGENSAPLALLVRAYNRPDAGTRNLVAPNKLAVEFAQKFYKGDPEYISDEKWWEAAREKDREKADKGAQTAPDVDAGGQLSDDPTQYLLGGTVLAPQKPVVSPLPQPQPGIVSEGEDLISRSRCLTAEPREYGYTKCPAPFKVRIWEVVRGQIGEVGEGEPCKLLKDGSECDFFFNPKHSFLRDYPVTYRELLLIGLADRFKVRDQLDITELFTDLMVSNYPNERVSLTTLREQAAAFFEQLREKSVDLLSVREREAIDCIHESVGEVEEICNQLIYNRQLLEKFQGRTVGAIEAVSFAPVRTLVRLIDTFPEEYLDGNLFKTPFKKINLGDPNSTERVRNQAKDRLLSFLKDAQWVLGESPSAPYRQMKDELIRCAHSLNFLEQEMEVELSN
ncbi:MAG: ATP-binding protein [Anaerolineae bacterium]|nr:ATP-binding protein [Anaerolineae bacterium]